MSHQSYQHLLNTLALEMKAALALAAQPALSRADKRMANIRYNRAVDRVRKLGFYPKFVERPDGGVEVKYFPLQKEEDMAEHTYQHGDVDDRDFPAPSPVQRCPYCALIYCEDNCPRCEQRAMASYTAGRAKHRSENFYRPHNVNPFTRAGRERGWLFDDAVELVICENGEYLWDLKEEKKRVRGSLHRREFRPS